MHHKFNQAALRLEQFTKVSCVLIICKTYARQKSDCPQYYHNELGSPGSGRPHGTLFKTFTFRTFVFKYGFQYYLIQS